MFCKPVFVVFSFLLMCNVGNLNAETVSKPVDSIADADTIGSGWNTHSTEYARLLSPLVFFHDVTEELFSLPECSVEDTMSVSRRDAVSMALLRMYVFRPDLVTDSEDNIRRTDETGNIPVKPVLNDVELTKEVEPVHQDDIVDITAPVALVTTRPNFWTLKGDYSMQFLQNFISNNWYKGGESNYSMIAAVILEANYDNKQKLKWDNKLEMKLGLQTTPSDTLRAMKTSEDLLRYTSKLGIQASKHWYYTLQMLAYTQFYKGYKKNDRKVYSDFCSPLNVNVALGMDYKLSWFKKKLNGTVNISPLAYNFRYVSRAALAKNYSIKDGKTTLHDFGSTFTADLTWAFSPTVSWRTRLYAFTTYHRAEVEWENTFTFKLTKYISSKVFLFPRFDDSSKHDDKLGYFQFKEYCSLGFNYSF